MPQFEAVASLSIFPVEVEIGGHVVRVPALPAADWLPVLMTGDAARVLDLVDDFSLYDAMKDGATTEEFVEEITILVESACGRALVTAFTIANFAQDRWDLVGPDLARIGIRFDQVSIAYALDAIYSTITRVLPEKELSSFVMQVDRAEKGDEVGAAPGIPVPQKLLDSEPLPASATPFVQTRPRTRPLWKRPPQVDLNERPKTQPVQRGESGQRDDVVPLASREQVRRLRARRSSGT